MLNWIKRLVSSPANPQRVLVVGIYLANKENAIEHIVNELSVAKRCVITQRWIGLNGVVGNPAVEAVTVGYVTGFVPKFELVNSILRSIDLKNYDFVIVCDDDVYLPKGFVDAFIEHQLRYNLSLCQPARTHNSYIDHAIVEQADGVKARRTTFVEIGPVFSVRRDIYKYLLPFDERAPMGWGLDFVWPVLAKKHRFRMGIVDATPVDHSMRAPVVNYSHSETEKKMVEYLSMVKHYSRSQAFKVLEEFP